MKNIIIDKADQYKKRIDSVKNNGGYIITASGKISVKEGDIDKTEINKVLFALTYFLSFINGNMTSIVAIKGFEKDENVWSDISGPTSSAYANNINWVPRYTVLEADTIWCRFLHHWENNDDKEFFNSFN